MTLIYLMCELLLNKDIAKDYISINGFSPEPLWADKPENIRNGGVCLYFKDHLPIKERCDLEILPETIMAEIKLNRKIIFLVLSYWHPDLSSIERKITQTYLQMYKGGKFCCNHQNWRF